MGNCKFRIIAVYNSPKNQVNKFLDDLDSLFDFNKSFRSPCYFVGDFNINILERNSTTNNYMNILDSFNYQILNPDRPTRISRNKETCIDHILCNQSIVSGNTKIIDCAVNEHLRILHTTDVRLASYK